MDAYDLHEKLLTEWRRLALIPSADSVKKTYNEVPVYINLNDNTYTVTDVITRDGKLILEIV
jgi:hypothetical protein